MRIPPYYRNPAWQRFFSGMVIGGAISWCIFIYIFGVWQEQHTALIDKQREEIVDLKEEKKIWQEEYKDINKRTIEQLTIQKINIKITNWEKYKLDMLSVSEIEDSVKDDISLKRYIEVIVCVFNENKSMMDGGSVQNVVTITFHENKSIYLFISRSN